MIDYRSEGGNLVCSFHGRIDTKAAEDLENGLLDKIQLSKEQVVFDFADLEYVASAFLRTCVKVARLASPGRVRIINASEEILHVYHMTGFDKLMELEK
ncbi:MAG: STAS domain-containing protein [Victivallales bacterium]|nr:STAS domain-containing protein [Victivallales bacterium]